MTENDCHYRSDALERVKRAQPLAQVAATMHQQLGAADTTNIMLWLLSIAPHVFLLPFAIKLSQLPPDFSTASSAEEETDIVRRHVAALPKVDCVLALLAASRVGDGSVIVFDVLLTALAKRLLVCHEPTSELSAVDREKVLMIVNGFLGPAGQLLALWQAGWVELLDLFDGNRVEAVPMFLDSA